jgi:ABC-2 type transport system permease protein
MNPLSDVGVVFGREVAPQLRNPLALIFGMMEPLIFLVLFGPLLTGMPGVTGASPWQWFVPGILIMIGLFGTTSTGYALLTEINTGSLERLLVTPVNRTAMLVGRMSKEVLVLVAQAMLIIVAVLPFGFQPYPIGMLLGLLILVTFGLGLGGLSFALAIASKKQGELFYIVQQTALFPLLLLSGVLLPMDAAPGWLRALSQVNPLTYLVNAERVLFSGELASASVLFGAITAVVIAVAGLAVGTRAMRRAAL